MEQQRGKVSHGNHCYINNFNIWKERNTRKHGEIALDEVEYFSSLPFVLRRTVEALRVIEAIPRSPFYKTL